MRHQKTSNYQDTKHPSPNLKLGPTKVPMILTKFQIKDVAEEITRENKTNKKKRDLPKKKKRKEGTDRNVEEGIVDQRPEFKAQLGKSLLM